MIPEELADFLRSGVSIHVATCDSGLTPAGMRVWALAIAADREHVEAFLYEPAAGPTLDNLRANGRMAIAVDRPSDSRACQIKGVFEGVRPCRDEERAEVTRQIEALFVDLEAIGVPREMFANWTFWPCLAVGMRVTDLFQQTPGPGAGERLP